MDIFDLMDKQNPKEIVHNIFNDFFGEENVDLQENNIIVHFPKVTISNEFDRSIDITHLWAKISLSDEGTIVGTFKLIRSELTEEQFFSGYSHSHIPIITLQNYDRWADPCLGSGPINGTITSLIPEFSEEGWRLFCLELSKYVTVESITGGPYKRFESIGVKNLTEEIKFPFLHYDNLILSNRITQVINSFIPYILYKKPFGFNFSNESYGIAMSDKDIFITLSNLFIEYYNSLPKKLQIPSSELYSSGIINKGKVIDGKLYYVGCNPSNRISSGEAIGKVLFHFKGEPVTFNIVGPSPVEDSNLSIFLARNVVIVIIDRILRTINNKYGQYENPFTTSGKIHKYI